MVDSSRLTSPAAVAILALTASQALAQTNALEEVIVTATKRAESLQDIPVTVTAFSAETIQEAGIKNAVDLAILTPSLNVNVNISPFNARLTIRGIGTAQTDPALEPSVGLFVDGVFLGRSGLGMSDLTDIQLIEVLQGPQGTLYGKNTNAGAIVVTTRQPNMDEFEGYVETSVGDYSMGQLTAAASGPIADSVAFRLSGNVHQRDGYYDNGGGKDLNDADDWNLQGKLLWEPSDDLDVMLSGYHVDRDTTCCAADVTQTDMVNNALAAKGLPRDKNDPYDYEVAVNVDSKFKMESDLASLIVDYERDWGTITSITGWNDYNYQQSTDADRSQLDMLSIQNDKYEGDSVSQELRFSADAGEQVEYQVGLFYYDQTTKRGDGSPFVFIGEDFLAIAVPNLAPLPIAFLAAPGDTLSGKFKLDTETFAVFSQAIWHFTESWHLKGGLRWTDEQKTADLYSATYSTSPSARAGGPSFLDSVSTPIDDSLDRSSDNVDWLASISWDVYDDIMLFATAATGTKSGGFNSVNGAPENREFDDEDTTSYELGVKSTLLDARMRVNASAFYTEIKDYQSQQQLPTGLGTFVSNQAEVESSGLDFYMEALPLPNLTLSAGLLYMHKYEITDGPDKGLALPFTPEYSSTLAATLVLPLADGNVYWRTDYSYMDDHSTNVARAARLQPKDFDDSNIVNVKLGWRNDTWNVSVWSRNLTDDKYASQTVDTFAVSGMDAYFLAPPRTYGATLRYDF